MRAPELANELMQWRADELFSLGCPIDASLMLEKARELRERLLISGIPSDELPKIDRHWLYRWRQQYNISIREVTTQVKVAHLRLCHSRMPFIRAYPREGQEMLFDAHAQAFAWSCPAWWCRSCG